jgi:hypothetical protein
MKQFKYVCSITTTIAPLDNSVRNNRTILHKSDFGLIFYKDNLGHLLES